MNKTLLLWMAAIVIALSLTQYPANAQGTTFPDVSANHWAYQAVTDLANEGYVKGYPDGSFLGKRTLTRFEFATVIDRIVATVNDLSTKVNGLPAPTTPTGVPVTQDDLNKIQVLVDTFQPELDAIKSNVSDLTTQLDSLRQDVLDTKAYALKAQKTATVAQTEADNSYGNSTSRKFSITGYIQSRFVEATSGTKSAFAQGLNTSANGGGVAAAYNGTYAEGGTKENFEVRRARVYIEGNPTLNTSYQIQFDASGAVTNYAAANSQLIMIQAFGTYKFGDASSKYPVLNAGLINNPFGYAVGLAPTVAVTPERPLAFQLTNNVGLFDSQDTDKGFSVCYAPKQIKATLAVINGSGRQFENIDNHADTVARVAYTAPTKIFTVGASYYNGYIARGRSTGSGDSSITQVTYQAPKKELFGLDSEASYNGFFADYEFVRGTYEKRSYFDQNFGTALTNPLGFETDNYVKGNQVQGSYIWGGYTFQRTTPRPFTLACDYDVFQRSMSSKADPGNSLQSSGVSGGNYQYFASGSSWDDVNAGFGAMYNLDSATRLRLWYNKPFAVAHAPGTPEPPKIGLYTAELQVRF